jgi:hypothetical protein
MFEKFMISIKLMKNSLIGMVPFLAVLSTQIILFTSLNAVKELNDMYDGKVEKMDGHTIVGKEFFETAMIIFGPKPKIAEDDYVKWALFIAYAFLIIVVNMKLVIAVIGETYGKQQISRVALVYQMKAMYLVELCKMF